MTLIVSPRLFSMFLRRPIVQLLSLWLMFLASMPLNAATAPRVNREILKIMKERTAVEQNLNVLKQQLKDCQTKLNTTTRKESQSFKALENIRTQILMLEHIITENQHYLEKLDRDIDRLQHDIQDNRQVYGRVSDDFRRTAVSVYKYGGSRDIEHVFASGSVNKAIMRTQYMGFFTRAVRHNVDELQEAAHKLESNRLALEQTYKQKAEMVREQEQQLKSWSKSKQEKEVVLDNLKKNKQEFAAQLADVQKKRAQLQSRIESLILAEQRAVEIESIRQQKIAEARRREAQRVAAKQREVKQREIRQREANRQEAKRQEALRLVEKRRETQHHEKERVPLKPEKRLVQEQESVIAGKETKQSEPAEPRTPEKESVTVVPEAGLRELEKVSADFDNAAGSLPWPVRNGVVAHKFGTIEDKDLKIVTTNNGIDITVPANTQVRAVSGGKVVQIAFLPTFGNIVIIRHPKSYLTVYANLGQLHVAKDDLIKSQQLVGLSGKMTEGGSVVHFEIWKGRVKQNPEKWLRR